MLFCFLVKVHCHIHLDYVRQINLRSIDFISTKWEEPLQISLQRRHVQHTVTHKVFSIRYKIQMGCCACYAGCGNPAWDVQLDWIEKSLILKLPFITRLMCPSMHLLVCLFVNTEKCTSSHLTPNSEIIRWCSFCHSCQILKVGSIICFLYYLKTCLITIWQYLFLLYIMTISS